MIVLFAQPDSAFLTVFDLSMRGAFKSFNNPSIMRRFLCCIWDHPCPVPMSRVLYFDLRSPWTISTRTMSLGFVPRPGVQCVFT